MKTKQEIAGNWLVRYTKLPLDAFSPYVLLTNFNNYVDLFCEQCGVAPKACLFLGKCGGISEKTRLGDYILPLAGIRGEGTSGDYFPPEIPALPAFMLQRAVSTALRDNQHDYWTGTVYTTNRRLWEHDERFKDYLRTTRAMAVDMETATLFTCGFYNHIPTGALLLVSDNPMVPEGIKTGESDRRVTQTYAATHVRMGIEALRLIIGERRTVRHLKFDW